MKRVFILLCLTLYVATINSQERFEPRINVVYDLGIDADKNQSFGIDFFGGCRINSLFMVGLGTGISWCNHLYEDAGINQYTHKYYDEYRESAAYIPLYIGGQFNFIKSGISPYLSLDLGGSFFIPFSDYAKKNSLGYMIRPAFGVDFPITKGKIFAEIGYKYQYREFELVDNKMSYSQLSLAIGYSF